MVRTILLCVLSAVVLCGADIRRNALKDPSLTDVSRDKVIAGLEKLRQKIARPEMKAVAKARGITTQQYFVESFREIAPEESLGESPLPSKEISGVWLWARVDSKCKKIRGLYSSLIRSLNGWGDPDLYAIEWESIAKGVVPTANDTFEYIHKSIVDGMLYRIIHREYEENLCNIQQSPMQLLYNLYNSLQLSQLKAYTLMQFSWLYRNTKNESLNYDDESNAIKDQYLARLSKQAEVAKDAMSKVSQALWRCDPREHVEDETYTSLSYFLQGFILNEVDMNTDGTCREDCPFYKYTKQLGCYKGNYCVKQPICKGNVVNCRFVDSDMSVCPSDYNKSKRRYEWIKYENGRVLGEGADGTCSKRVDKVDSWWRWLFWHCSYCFCICDESENTKSDRYFSLQPTQSDVKNNRVLTGIKFVKRNQVIYIEGQEGELRPNGEINSTTLHWIPVKEINPHSNEFIEGLEYYKASFHQRQVDLDDLMAPPDHVLTGVKWRKVGHHLNFEIKVCRWNFTTGQLLQNGLSCQWISNDNTDASEKPRQKIYLNTPDVPTKIRVQSRVDSKTDQFVEFTHTDLSADVAQSAVPYIDTQPVIPDPAVPLIGAGIYHKGMYKSGGFIAPKVFTMDYTKHMQTDFDAI